MNTMMQVAVPVHVLFVSSGVGVEIAEAVASQAASQEALQECVNSSLASAVPGWPGSAPSIVRHLRSRGAIVADAMAEATLEITVTDGAQVAHDACPEPSLDAAATVTVSDVLEDLSNFLQYEAAPTLAQLDVLEPSVQVR